MALQLAHEEQMQFVPLLLRPCEVPLLWRAYQNPRFTTARTHSCSRG